VVLKPGEGIAVKIGFSPHDLVTTSCFATIASTAAGNTHHRVPIRGYGTQKATVADTFVQTSGRMDVLFVVDDSPSMAPFATQVQAAMGAFLTAAQGTDYRVAVTTTSAGADMGLLTSSWVTPQTEAPLAKLASGAQTVGTGAIAEQGLAAAWFAATHPGSQSPGSIPPVLRDDATLEIVIISDEEDASPARYLDPLAINQLKGQHGLEFARIRVHAVTASGAGCTPWAGQTGDSYTALANLTGGATADLCDADFDPMMTELVEQATASVRRQFRLSSVPGHWGEAMVTVDGQGCGAGWSYAALHNTATAWDEGCMPAPGSLIEIEYPVSCPQ